MQQRLRETLYFFRTNLVALLTVTLPLAALASLVVHSWGEPLLLVDDKPQVQAGSAALLAALYPLALGVKLAAIHRLANGQALAIAPLLGEALRLWPVLLGISLLLGMAVGIGLLVLFIIPGAYAYARLGLAPIIAVTEGKGVLESLGQAWQRSRDIQFDLFMITLLIGSVLVLVMLAVFYMVGQADAGSSPGADLVARAVNELLFCLLSIAFYRYWSLGQTGRQQ